MVSFLVRNIWFKAEARIFGVPIHVSPPHIWWYLLNTPGQRYGRFKRKRRPDIYDPKRWGGYVLGVEIGYRG